MRRSPSFLSRRFAVFGLLFVCVAAENLQNQLDLGSAGDGSGSPWVFVMTGNASLSGKATVPGDIYTDLFNNKLVPEPLSNNNDIDLAWVGRSDWSYSRTFDAPSSALAASVVRLHFAGLDTFAKVFLNGQMVLDAKNQFVGASVDVKPLLRANNNSLRVDFRSAVRVAADLAGQYRAQTNHYVPPDCPLPIQNGECHPNFIRKAQASFSWDWGPSFPAVGIWLPVALRWAAAPVLLERVEPLVVPQSGGAFLVTTEATVSCAHGQPLQFSLTAALPELGVKQFSSISQSCGADGLLTVSVNVSVDALHGLQLWWPNGYGAQKLYDLQTTLAVQTTQVVAVDRKRVGFRSIELIQDLVDPAQPAKGRHFYFKVNGVPVFLKGSNLIPVSVLSGRDSETRKRWLLQSSREANLNTLRVWGGGLFEADSFYDLADEHGILLWHDMMFACALYPVDAAFLDNVRTETRVQVRRLRHHASILVWAGNNENELAIKSGWWYVPNYPQSQVIADYRTLYRDTVQPLTVTLDPSRPFLLSSPSNGVHTEQAGGVDDNPGSEFYGDIHFYNEFINLWKDGSYQIPRCATEFGVQSFPHKDTMLSWIPELEYYYGSKTITNRQHHTGGILTLLNMVFTHFNRPTQCANSFDLVNCPYVNGTSAFLAPFSYLTQLHQALAMQAQSEHYRRWRGRLNDEGKGNTMCALYWQLNDVWAAPSWSSIDHNLEWKVLHYTAKRFFAEKIVSMFVDGNSNVEAFVVSDATQDVTGASVKLEMLPWSTFTPFYSTDIPVTVKALAATPLPLPDLQAFANNSLGDASDFVVRATLFDAAGKSLSPEAVLLPDKFYNQKSFGDVSIASVTPQATADQFSVTVKATANAPFVWLDLTTAFKRAHPGLLFRFSDNAFTATHASTTVTLTFESKNISLLANDVTVCHLTTCFQNASDSQSKHNLGNRHFF